METIKRIKGYEDVKDIYFITTCGRIFSKRRDRKDLEYFELKIRTDEAGYSVVSLDREDGTRKTAKPSRLVGLAFIPNPENKPEIDHIDRIRNNDVIGNLRWVTKKENCANRKKYNTRPVEKQKQCIAFLDGEEVARGTTLQLSELLNINSSGIRKVLTGYRKTYKKYTFKYL